MTELRLEVWRLVVAEHAEDIAAALADELGPIRARKVTVTAGEGRVIVDLDTGERDVERSVWACVVQLARVWPELSQGADVGLEVRAGDETLLTSGEGMAAVAAGCDYGTWRMLSVEGVRESNAFESGQRRS
jgi:hypothetical protein